eukprot:gene15463-17047_t
MARASCVKSLSQLDMLLLDLADHEARFPCDEVSVTVSNELQSIMQMSLGCLESKYRLFHGALLGQAGSMKDGTRIGTAGEFDFNFEVPALYRQLFNKDGKPYAAENFNWHAQKLGAPIKLKDDDFLYDIFFPSWETEENNRSKRSLHLIFKDRKDKFRDELACMISQSISIVLQEIVPRFPSWKYVAKVNSPTGKSYLQILKYESSDIKLFVSVDICLSLTIPFASKNVNDAHVQILFDIRSVNMISFARKSEVAWEQEKICQLPTESVEKKCYRVLKYLTKTFFTSNFGLGILDYKCDIDTYAIKTTLLQMLVRDTAPWKPCNIGQKTLEILEALHHDLLFVAEKGQGTLPSLFLKDDDLDELACRHPKTGEPGLFKISAAVGVLQERYINDPSLRRPLAIAEECKLLIKLLEKVNAEGRMHFDALHAALKQQTGVIKDGTHQDIIMNSFQSGNNVTGFYNNRLQCWYVIDGEELKNYLRQAKYGIPVQPDNKPDDCIVMPKMFSPLKWIICDEFDLPKDSATDLLEMDVFDKNRVVCWNVSESTKLYELVQGTRCLFCDNK